MNTTDNFRKHTHRNPIQKILISNFYNNIFSILKDLKLNNILDAGCGEGFTLQKIREKGISKNVEGIDFSKDAINLGKKLYPKLSLKTGDIYNLPYKNNYFDLVISTEVLEHLKNPENALSEIRRVTKKYALISVPNEPFFMISNLLRGKNLKRFGNDIEHINHWTNSNFKTFIRKNKFDISLVKKPFPWTIVLAEK